MPQSIELPAGREEVLVLKPPLVDREAEAVKPKPR
jgi:hypothetical protein